jgi:transposase
MGKIKSIGLSAEQIRLPENGYKYGRAHFLRQRCLAVLLKSEGLSSPQIALKVNLCQQSINKWVDRFLSDGIAGLGNRLGQGAKPIISREANEEAIQPAERESGESLLGGLLGQDGLGGNVQTFFIRLGARYRRIRKRPRGKPSPQLYAYKCEKLQKLEDEHAQGLIDLYYGDESHVCTSGYVPYGWQFSGEDYHVPSDQKFRLNCFAIIDRNSNYDGFTTTESINSEKIIGYLDGLSFRISKKTVVVLDNARIHQARIVMRHRELWQKRVLFLFFLPPYSPHLNLAETLWRILKGKWIKPQDYISKDNLFY